MKNVLKIKESRWLHAGKNGGLVDAVYDEDYNEIPVPKGTTTASCLKEKTTGRMCCLGFAACKAGLKQSEILESGAPSDLASNGNAEIFREKFPWLFRDNGDSEAAHSLMRINDDPDVSMRTRRAIIKRIFKNNGWNVEFVP